MKQINESNTIIEEDILSEFDYKIIEEMKSIAPLKHWTDEQFGQYCLVLRTYTKIILSITENEKQITPTLKFNRTILKQVA